MFGCVIRSHTSGPKNNIEILDQCSGLALALKLGTATVCRLNRHALGVMQWWHRKSTSEVSKRSAMRSIRAIREEQGLADHERAADK